MTTDQRSNKPAAVRDTVIVEVETRRQATKSGLVIAEDPKVKRMPDRGTVVSVGPNVLYELSPGQRVAFLEDRPQGFWFDFDDGRGRRPCLAVHQDKIAGILEEDDEHYDSL